MEEVKLYKVEFNEYTNSSRDTVSTKTGNGEFDYEYLEIPYGGLIIKENEIEYYRQFGHGFKTLTFIGSMLESIDNDGE